ncbi:peptidylprolyl isomerase [Rhodonellum sp.]|uniref:peptidylprolyl isomerase n=1 Tax=Rhodonellum sp. TaxID=2231180 RepID=UPI002719D56B|nr:peptidylprolyl isomerase [Rhodonellum sp.]MDO9553533.1 peptidylprolyl isomerase [Rhodonellum sp.]
MPSLKIHFGRIRSWLSLAFVFGMIMSEAFAQKEERKIALISTSLGDIHILLHDQTPKHQASFIQLATAGYWDSLTFNRVIPNFVAQAGCPDTEEGFNDPEYLLAPEFHPDLKHGYGALGAGRDDNPDKLSARCQFYIVQNKDGLARLDGDYTVFGQVIRGMDVVDQIVAVQRDSLNQPLTPISMKVSIQ